VAQDGVVPDSVPAVPMRISLGWLVAGVVPEEKAVVDAVAPAEVSIPVTPANSSMLMWVSADDG
jgi:hypothetical protein